jgi:predicted enzyme related to lactoylglutathione lyase
MGDRTSYAPGTFCWTDLATSDPERARRFYAELFGWDREDMPVPGGSVYTMLRREGRDAAALYAAPEGQPPAWLAYVSVEDADATSGRAVELGATALHEPFDVIDAGRMAVLQDPTGAVCALWQPGRHFGAAVVNGPGAFSLSQLNTSDPDAAAAFYSELFGWQVRAAPVEDVDYRGVYVGEALNGAIMQLPPGSAGPSHWLVYFGSADVDADARRIGELGGTVVVPPTDVPGGRFLVAQDPPGAYFALFAGRFDP